MSAGLLERTIMAVAPQWGARRAFARAQVTGLENAMAIYDGAARQRWLRVAGGTSANTEIAASLATLRNASRDLRRNNAIAANCISVIGSHVVGAGIIPSVEASNARLKDRIKGLVTDHLNTPAVDFDERHDLAGLERLVSDTVVESGEALIVRYRPPARLRLPVPMQVRVLEPDYLDVSKDGPTGDGGYIYQGIEVDPDGRRVAYWLFDEHPGGGVSWRLPSSRRVAAADVKHVYRQDRPGQMRGVPWCTPVIVALSDLHDYEEADLVRQKIAACFSVFLKGAESATGLGQQFTPERSRAGNIVERLEPGLVQRLPPNVEAQFAVPPTVSGQAEFVNGKLHRICAGYGVPFELGTGILSEVSFISGRIGQLQFNRNVDEWRWHMVIPHACAGIGRWFAEAAAIVAGSGPDRMRLKWTPPKREMLEPSKEVPAMRDAVRSGLSSLSLQIRELGDDPEEIFAEIAADNALLDKLKLQFDSDGRKPLNGKPPVAAEKTDGP